MVFQTVLTAAVISMGALVLSHEREIHMGRERYVPAAVLRAEMREIERALDARIDALPSPEVDRRLTAHERRLEVIEDHIRGHTH
jgi:hypothetical protein